MQPYQPHSLAVDKALAEEYLRLRYADQVAKFPTLAETSESRYIAVNLPYVLSNRERMYQLRDGDFSHVSRGIFA